MSFSIKCDKCNHEITEKDIDYSNCVNDEGEDYHEFDLTCGNCFNEIFKGSGWGETSFDEVVGEITSSLFPSPKKEIENGRKVLISFGDSIVKSTSF